MDFATVLPKDDQDIARRGLFLRRFAEAFQQAFTAMEKCTQPVVAAVHSGCVGGGMDMITAADIRLCSADAWFEIKVREQSCGLLYPQPSWGGTINPFSPEITKYILLTFCRENV